MTRALRIKPGSKKGVPASHPKKVFKGSTRQMAQATSGHSQDSKSKMRKGRNTRQQEEVVSARKVATRRQTLSWMGVLLWRCLLLCLTIGMVGGGVYILQKGVVGWGALRIKSIEINGLSHLKRADILAVANLEIGDSWLWNRLSQHEKSIRSLPAVEEVQVTRKFPSRIQIDLKEAEPVAITQGGAWTALYANGSVVDGHAWLDADLPIVDSGLSMSIKRRKEVCGFLGRIRTEKPATFARFSQIIPENAVDLAVILRDGQAQVILDPMAKSLNSIDFLESLLREHANSWRAGANIDLRVPNHAYVL